MAFFFCVKSLARRQSRGILLATRTNIKLTSAIFLLLHTLSFLIYLYLALPQ